MSLLYSYVESAKTIMPPAPLPFDENERLAALRNYQILDTPPEQAFDSITQYASTCFNVPIAVISLVDTHRQWFKSHYGLDACETSRDIAFCAYTIVQRELLVVPDATNDPRFATNPLVTGEPYIRFYAGMPLFGKDGHAIGTLCLVDTKPRPEGLSTEQIAKLQHLTGLVATRLELRLNTLRLNNFNSQFRKQAH